jgi:hypothetical protein
MIGRSKEIVTDTAGMTLLELLGYVAGLALFVNMCAVAFIQGNRLAQIGETALLRMDTMSEIQRDFTTAVHQAVSVEADQMGFASGPSQVVLRIPRDTEQPNVSRFIVFGGGDGVPLHMTKYAVTDGTLELERSKNYPVDFEIVELSYDRPPREGTRTVHLNLELFRERIDNRTGSGARITATLRAAEDGL